MVNPLARDPVTMALHELRSPLGLVATAARAAAADCDDEYIRRRCEVILRTAERMLRTAVQVLSLAGSLDEDPEELFDPVTVTGRVVADLAELGIPAAFSTTRSAGAWLVRGRPAQLESMITSVISNAVDHGAAAGNITVTLSAVDSHVEITLENSKCHPVDPCRTGARHVHRWRTGETARCVGRVLGKRRPLLDHDQAPMLSRAVTAPLHQVSALLLA